MRSCNHCCCGNTKINFFVFFFPHYLINDTLSEKFTLVKVRFDFLRNVCQGTCHSENNSERYHKCTYVFYIKHPLFSSDLNET
jgi:hypothetical protein